MTETEVQNLCLLNASKLGWRLFRNNVGVAIRKDGVPIRYGLANITKAMNKNLKSSDLIGIKPNGQFVAIECKASNVNISPPFNGRMIAQENFLKLIRNLGGYGEFNNTGNLV